MTEYLHSATEAGKRLAAGDLVAFPTETVYGLGGDARDSSVINRIFQAKGRPSNNPLIVHVASIAECNLACDELPPIAASLLSRFSPGPLTVVVPKRKDICSEVSGGLNTVGIRIPSNFVAREVLRSAGVPIAAPSANLSGKPSCTTWQSVREDLDGRIDAILCSEDATLGLESTVVDCTGTTPVILRPGRVTLEDIRELHADAKNAMDLSVHGPQSQNDSAALSSTPVSPGLMHPHYQPKARVVLFETLKELDQICSSPGPASLAVVGVDLPLPKNAALGLTFCSLPEYAAGFYEFLRTADRHKADLIAVQLAPNNGIGIALRDRQRRAAGET
ncbi:MAG: L-threonylcarbamoyladenylate synthase [Aureliella sp.]